MREVPRAPPVTFTHCANPLKILERSRFGLRDLISVEVKCRHSAQQKVSCFRTKPGKRPKFGNRHAYIFGYAELAQAGLSKKITATRSLLLLLEMPINRGISANIARATNIP